MAKQKITISEALGWKQTLSSRYGELTRLRDQNSTSGHRYIGANADKAVEVKPTYDVKELDKLITRIAREQRMLDAALKKTNATVQVLDYEQDDDVLGEVV
jgi:hypothetical protein